MGRVNPVTQRNAGEAVVTGASEGIGAALARALAQDGWDLLLVARREPLLEQLAGTLRAEFGRSVRVLRADLATAEGVEATVHAALEGGRIPGLLVNNAGFGIVEDTLVADLARITEMLRLNIEAPVALTHHLGRAMQGRGGTILNVASTAAFMPCPGMGVYAATKAFLLSFSESLHVELSGKVTVVALCPGYTQSGFHRVAGLDRRELKFKPMTAEAVAAIALEAIRSQTPVRICGSANYLLTVLPRVLPRGTVRRAAARVFRT